jgi:coupling of ubiquitin conjugation to ER degradation protein 1
MKPPPPRPPPTSASSSRSNATPNHKSLIDKFKLHEAVKRGVVPDEPPKVWEATPNKRQELLQQKKDAMVLQARKFVFFISIS